MYVYMLYFSSHPDSDPNVTSKSSHSAEFLSITTLFMHKIYSHDTILTYHLIEPFAPYWCHIINELRPFWKPIFIFMRILQIFSSLDVLMQYFILQQHTHTPARIIIASSIAQKISSVYCFHIKFSQWRYFHKWYRPYNIIQSDSTCCFHIMFYFPTSRQSSDLTLYISEHSLVEICHPHLFHKLIVNFNS